MEKICLLLIDYTTKWRKVIPKLQYFEEFETLNEEQIIQHNLDVLDNHDFLMNSIKKLNELDIKNLKEEEKELIENILLECETMQEKDFLSII